MQRNEDTISIQIQSQRFYTFETRTAHSSFLKSRKNNMQNRNPSFEREITRKGPIKKERFFSFFSLDTRKIPINRKGMLEEANSPLQSNV